MSLVLKRKYIFIIFSLVFSLIYSLELFAVYKAETKGGLNITNEKYPDCWCKMGARLFLDESVYSGNHNDKLNEFPNGAEIRIFYWDFSGGIGKDISYILSLTFMPILNERSIGSFLRDAHIDYSGLPNTKIQIGQVPIPASLENWMESEDTVFLEVSLMAGCFFPLNDYGIGIYADRTFRDTFLLQGVIFQPRQDIILQGLRGLGRSDQLSEVSRLVFSPIHTKTNVIHLGIWGRHQSLIYALNGSPAPLSTVFLGFADTPEVETRRTMTLVDTGPMRARSLDFAGLEAAYLCGPLMFQSEYLYSRVQQVFNNNEPPDPILPASTVKFSAWYFQVSYVLTGEPRVYDFAYGLFRRPVPDSPCGAWEVGARLSHANLEDKNIHGGKETNFTLGINWFLNEQLRFCANYIYADANPPFDFPSIRLRKRKLNIFAMRFQMVF